MTQPSTEPRYTLDEARAELARQACHEDGHDWKIQLTAGVSEIGAPVEIPLGIQCARGCGDPGYHIIKRDSDSRREDE